MVYVLHEHVLLERSEKKWLLLVADPGEGPRGPAPPYFYTKLRPEGPEKKFFETVPPYLRVWMTGPPRPLI